MTKEQLMVIKYKFSFPEHHLPILNETGKYVGSLVPLTHRLCNYPKVYEAMAKWRQENMEWFLTYFNATPERTKEWLNNVYLRDDNRLMFLLYTYPEYDLIGHYGITHITDKYAEMDNGMRGEQGVKGFMFYMEIAFLSWLFGVLNMDHVNLWVVSHNERVQKWHVATGYSYGRTCNLSKVVHNNETKLLIDSDEGELVPFKYVEFVHSREALIKAHPWVLNVYPWRDYGKND